MDEADSSIVEPQIELTTAVKDSSKDPMLTPLSKVPLGFVKPPTYSFATGSTSPCETFESCCYHKPRWALAYEEFPDYKKRYRTFDTWPKQMNPTPADLVQVGSFYTGIGDTVFVSFVGEVFVLRSS